MADTPAGFEYAGLFYEWHLSTIGKDLLLIDRISGMSVEEFFELVEDKYDLTRPAVMLTLVATSMRHRHPDRSVERLFRTVMDLDMADVNVVGGDDDEEGDEDGPPSSGGDVPSDTSSPTLHGSPDLTSETLPVTPV